jgi:glycosyltransferase involved in cell wall biosynthesis
VTVVTPSYNQAAFLEEAIESVLAQDFAQIEYAIVDGGSTDGSVEIIRRYEGQLAWWVSESDAGQAAALNKAFGRARGDILGWVSSDDTLLPGAIARVVDELESDREALLVYGEALFVDGDGRALFPLAPRPFDVATMVSRCQNHVVQPGSLFRRQAFELAGPFVEDAHYLFDFEFVLRLATAGGKVKLIPDRLATYRVHTESKSGGGSLLKANDYIRFADRFLAGSGLPEAEEGRASAYLAAGDYFYDAGRYAEARRYLWRALRRKPTRRAASLLGRALARSVG